MKTWGQKFVSCMHYFLVPVKSISSMQLRRQTENGFLIVEWAVVNDNRQVCTYIYGPTECQLTAACP